MANTTNFGWETPDDTDLVKDGAAAIRTLGSAIDTSLVDLKGGTTGQVLSKASNTDLDFTWSSVDPLTILDAKGDLISATAADSPARLPVGTNGQLLTADSSTSTGLKWATVSSGGMTLIQETSANAASSLSFSSIPSTYKHLLLVWEGIYHSATGSWFDGRFNNDSAANYAGQLSQISGSAVTLSSTNDGDSISFPTQIVINYSTFGRNITGVSTLQSDNSQGVLWIYNYASTSNFKKYWLNYSYRQSQATNYYASIQGVYKSTSAISSIDFYRGTGTSTFSNATSTSIRLYGVS